MAKNTNAGMVVDFRQPGGALAARSGFFIAFQRDEGLSSSWGWHCRLRRSK
jgi:hypothetical protein